MATESSNNVTVAGSMVPLLTLGIPGAPPDAVILGVLMMHGLRPGIELFTTGDQLRAVVLGISLFVWVIAISWVGFYVFSVAIISFLVYYLARARRRVSLARFGM